MKSNLVRSAAALAVMAAFSGSASAVALNVVADVGTLTDDITFLEPNQRVASGALFDFAYSFTVTAPYTSITASMNWVPNEPMASFTGQLYSASCDGLSCTSIGEAIATFTSTDQLNWRLPGSGFLPVAEGTYAYRFYGQNNDVGRTGFSGQTTARVPAPAALGLVGLGLLGMGISRRRRA